MDSSNLKQWRRADVPEDQIASQSNQKFARLIGRVPQGLRGGFQKKYEAASRKTAHAWFRQQEAAAEEDWREFGRAHREWRKCLVAMGVVLIDVEFCVEDVVIVETTGTGARRDAHRQADKLGVARPRERGACTGSRRRGSRRITRSSSRSGDGGDPGGGDPPGVPLPAERGHA